MSKMPHVVSAAPKLAARAKAQRRDRWSRWRHRLAWGSALVVPLALAGWLLLGSSVFAVDRVVVSGEHRLSAADVEAAVAVEAGTPLARVDLGAVEKRVRALDAVASVSVSRGWPNTLRVAVVERAAAVAVRDGDHYALLDLSGVQFATAPRTPRGVMRVDVRLADREALTAALAVLQSLPTTLRAKVGLVRAPSAQQVRLELYDRRAVIWGSAEDSAKKLAAAQALLRLPGTVYDVSSPEVVTRR